MDMVKISSGKLRAIGYDPKQRLLEVHLEDGSALQYAGVSEELWRRLRSSGSAWSLYRDQIEEEFTARRVSGKAGSTQNPLDDLFGKS